MKSAKVISRTTWSQTSRGNADMMGFVAANLDDDKEISGYTIDKVIAGRKAWMLWGRYAEDASVKQDLMLTQQEKTR